jgi:hypothetical protein
MSIFQRQDGDRRKVELFCRFVATSISSKTAEHARELLTVRAIRKQHLNEETNQAVELGLVRGNFGIQLLAYLQLSPAENAAHAMVRADESGFYECVIHLHLSQTDLSSKKRNSL